MSNDKFPQNRSGAKSIDQFISRVNQLPQRKSDVAKTGGRLLFALDATASRQPSWDRACQLQAQMFKAADTLNGLELQLCYYRGFNEFHYSPWLYNSQELLRIMTAVQCLGGYTQLERVLDHSLKESSKKSVQAVIIIGDAVEENAAKLHSKAGKLGMLGVPLFMFQEGRDPAVRRCFQQMAALSKGAYATFDEGSAAELADLLAAVATFASGGFEALKLVPGAAAQHLLQQLKS